MEVLNVLGLILGIISSVISIYVFVIDRRKRQPSATPARSRQHASAPAEPTPGQPQPSAGRAGSIVTLARVGAVFWGVLGFLCLAEGSSYGEPLLLMLGALFFWLAYKMWKA